MQYGHVAVVYIVTVVSMVVVSLSAVMRRYADSTGSPASFHAFMPPCS
jgi:hypothetical protein